MADYNGAPNTNLGHNLEPKQVPINALAGHGIFDVGRMPLDRRNECLVAIAVRSRRGAHRLAEGNCLDARRPCCEDTRQGRKSIA